MDLSWMAWTAETTAFFIIILFLILCMSAWEYFSPGGHKRKGILRLETTRGDRLFLSLLGSAYINLGWLFLFGGPLGVALFLSVVYAILVFCFV